MQPNFICTADDMSFTSLEALEAHEKSGHSIKGVSTKNQEINPELAETLRQIQEAEKAKQAVPKLSVDLVQPTIIPLKLEYIFTGVDQAGHLLKTLEIDINNLHFVIGYCDTEKKQIVSWQVENLATINQTYLDSLPKSLVPTPTESTPNDIKLEPNAIIQPKKEKK